MNQDNNKEKRIGEGAISPPKKYGVPLPKDRSRCEGCPYPRVGFICWSPDGTCMKTDMEKIHRRSKGR